MTKIGPFKALVYNQENISDLSQVVCPPYDIISSAQQEHFHALSPYNLIHILLGKDIAGEDKYARAAQYFKEWQKQNVLVEDESPAIYFYSQHYTLKGEKKTRLGFIALMKLESKNSSVFAHENTRKEPKEDRLRLLKRVRANLSPIFAVFKDEKRIIQRTYARLHNQAPFIEVTDEEKTLHRVWKIRDADTIALMQAGMASENVYIADGHHRYEVACAFRDEMLKKGKESDSEEGFNYIMTYFTNTDFRGLTILPVHRLVATDVSLSTAQLETVLSEHFHIEEIKGKGRFFFLMNKGGCTEHVLGMYRDKRFTLLRLKNIKTLDKIMHDKPREYRLLDVSIFNHLILKRVLNIDIESKDGLKFTQDENECIADVDAYPAHIAFFFNPVKIEQIIAVASQGERMPSKSTYFYPKVISGLLINKL
jgi:uncharacterized protein (DUF1015 family)